VTLPRWRGGLLAIRIEARDAGGVTRASGAAKVMLDPGKRTDARVELAPQPIGTDERPDAARAGDGPRPDGGAPAPDASGDAPRDRPPSEDGPPDSPIDTAAPPATDTLPSLRGNGTACTTDLECASAICAGTPGRCCGARTEVCNGLDDTCDGLVDEASCPVPATSWLGRTYLFISEPLSWSAARAYCARYGYHLVSIESVAENAFITMTASMASGVDGWWIGYFDIGHEGTWTWDGGSTSPYVNWSPTEPNNCMAAGTVFCPGENCAMILTGPALAVGKWNDSICEPADSTLFKARPFICEARSGPALAAPGAGPLPSPP
jgi:hypothetical protein